MQLDDSTELAAHADAIARGVAPRGRLQVQLREGVPRGRVLRALGHRLADAAIVVLPPLRDPDASVHGLLQAAAPLGPQAVEEATKDATSLRDRARATGEALARAGRALVVWVPASWSVSDEAGDLDQQLRCVAAESVLGGWLSVGELRVVILAHGSSADLMDRSAGVVARQHYPLGPPVAVLPDDALWGSYAEGAASVRRALRNRPGLTVTGQQLRLLVALVGLGLAPGTLLDGTINTRHRTIRSRDLAKQLSEALAPRAMEAVADGVLRFLQARRPMPREMARAIAHVPDEHQALITDCLGEGEDLIEVDDGLREGLRAFRRREGVGLRARSHEGERQDPSTDPAVHLALANYHQSLDGAPRLAAAWGNIDHWLEKAHHLGLSGALGAERWEQLERPTRELYWDRARSLSFDHREYLEAARLYQECIDRFDRHDAYSWHYLGYNLDRAGVRRKDAERAFRKAVELRPDHPWYNGRLVTFLIDQARFRAAQDEWGDALERMDPGGEYVAESPWLAKETHRHVVKAWLRFGKVRRAREVFNDIPQERFSEEKWYQDLREAIEDAEEALRLGESVYPSTTWMNERWMVPYDVRMRATEDHALRSWFPGRVAAVDQEAIQLALGVPHEDPEKRRLISRTLTREEWQRYARCALEEGSFIFLAIYDDPSDPQGIVQIFPQPSRSARFPDEAEPDKLRYLRGTHA